MALLYTADPERGTMWRAVCAQHMPELDFRTWPDVGNAQDIRYLVGWQLSPEIMAAVPNVEVVFSIGAGVDQLNMDLIPPHIPVVRMLEPGIQQGMVEYVTMTSLALHRDLIHYREAQSAQRWHPLKTPPAATRRIGIMGMGDLGTRVADSLRPFGFALSGWRASATPMAGVRAFHGTEALPEFLQHCDILICLLPLTPATRSIINAQTLAHLPRGAGLVLVGRGGHMVSADVLAALDSGQVSGAFIDVFEDEPLPAAHAFWRHPKVFVTPHISGQTSLEDAAHALIANLRRHAAGTPMVGLVERARGY